jgi:hypothetical protein
LEKLFQGFSATFSSLLPSLLLNRSNARHS